jgi:phosphoribosylformylglycinamidine synthase subunit PurL
VVCAGALPTAVTNNLNFGSPLRPRIYHQLREAVLGMAEACALFETPVTGGNVSLYNETDGKAVYPTPVIGMVGLLEDVEAHATSAWFRSEGDAILLLGENREEIGGSEYLYRTEGIVAGRPPAVDLLAERRLQHGVLALIQKGLLRSAHDCAEGGLAFALLESALGEGEAPFGVDVELHERIAPVALFFGESTGRVVVSCAPEDEAGVLETARGHGVPVRVLGRVGPPGGAFSMRAPRGSLQVEVGALAELYFGTLPALMEGAISEGDPGAREGA